DNQGVSYAAAGNYVSTCAPATYYAITAGVTWKPLAWLSLRPNIRYDWVDGSNPKMFDVDANGVGQKTEQFLFSTDVTVKF
ncbi:MAG: outer membrane beta-barrel protein, partial [Methylobacter sp.]